MTRFICPCGIAIAGPRPQLCSTCAAQQRLASTLARWDEQERIARRIAQRAYRARVKQRKAEELADWLKQDVT